MTTAYAKSGVDIEKADRFTSAIGRMVSPTLNAKTKRAIGGYASLYEISPGRFIAATTDGVGTKLKLAFAMKRHDTVGIDLVAMSVNDLVCTGAEPLFFLDYFATGKLDLRTSKKVLKGIVKGCQIAGCALTGGETAEMPSMYAQGEYDLAGFAVGTVSRERLLDGSRVRPGDTLIGIESSGVHSNGYSLVRKLFKMSERAWIKKLLEPTRIYVAAARALQENLGRDLHAMAHITGSGFLNIPRINENFDYFVWMPPTPRPLFEEIVRRGSLSPREAFTTFNMGIGMVAAVKSGVSKTAIAALSRAGYHAHVIGQVEGRARGESRVFVKDGEDELVLA